MQTDTDAEPRFTLQEARALILRERCEQVGHDINHMVNAAGEVISLHCPLCDKWWKVEAV